LTQMPRILKSMDLLRLCRITHLDSLPDRRSRFRVQRLDRFTWGAIRLVRLKGQESQWLQFHKIADSGF
jgi:hypothetical protein